MSRPETGLFALCPNINAPNPQPWGSLVNFALGASVFFTILLVELAGSVFMKNISVVIGLIVGIIISVGIGKFEYASIDAAPSDNSYGSRLSSCLCTVQASSQYYSRS